MPGWYYMKKGWIEDRENGPIADADLLQMAFDGELKMKSVVRHEAHTRNQWVFLEQVRQFNKGSTPGAGRTAGVRIRCWIQ